MAGASWHLLKVIILAVGLTCCAVSPASAENAGQAAEPTHASQDNSGIEDGEVSRAMLRLWESALQDVRAGAYRTALPKLERLVSAAPGETQFRLELARTLFFIGVGDRARYHFNLSLGDPTLSEAEVAVVDRYLDRIAERSAWSGQFSFAVIPESNPGQRTSTTTLNIGGLPFEISSGDRDSAGVGLSLKGRLRWSPRLSRDLRGRFELAGRQEIFDQDEFNDLFLRGVAGLDLLGDRGSRLGMAVTYQQRWIAGQEFSYGPGLEISGAKRLGNATRGWARLSVTDLEHATLTERDGLRTRLDLGVRRAITQRFMANGSIFAQRVAAQAEDEAYEEVGVRAGGRYAFKGGITMGLHAWVAHRRNDAAQSFFPDLRDDIRWGGKARFTHRDISWNGFAPEVSVRYERRSSNIELYDYENIGLSIGVTRDF